MDALRYESFTCDFASSSLNILFLFQALISRSRSNDPRLARTEKAVLWLVAAIAIEGPSQLDARMNRFCSLIEDIFAKHANVGAIDTAMPPGSLIILAHYSGRLREIASLTPLARSRITGMDKWLSNALDISIGDAYANTQLTPYRPTYVASSISGIDSDEDAVSSDFDYDGVLERYVIPSYFRLLIT